MLFLRVRGVPWRLLSTDDLVQVADGGAELIGAKAAEMEERNENEVCGLTLQGLMRWLRVGLEYNWQVWLQSLWCVCNLPGRCGGVWGQWRIQGGGPIRPWPPHSIWL